MPIRLAPKEGFAEIPDDVVEKIKELRSSRAKQISQQINELKLEKSRISAPSATGHAARNSYRSSQIDAEVQGLHNTFASLKRTGGGNVLDGAKRGGFSGVMMRMRKLPFSKFYLKSRTSTHTGQQDWIIGMTHEVVTRIDHQHSGLKGQRVGPTTYNIGKYYIAVLCQAIGTHTPTFHLMPESNPKTMARHMHHHVATNRFGNDIRENPLDWTPANCYGTFQGAINGTFLNADIPELFRMLHLFTKTLNPHSPLLSMSQLPHAREVSE